MYKFRIIISVLALVFLAACNSKSAKEAVITRFDSGISANKISASIHAAAKELGWVTSDIPDQVFGQI